MPSITEQPPKVPSAGVERAPKIPPVIEKEDLNTIGTRLEEFKQQGDYMNVARTLARLQYSGFRLKEERKEVWLGLLRNDENIEASKMRKDPRRLALYYSYLKQLGSLDGEAIPKEDQQRLSKYYSDVIYGKATEEKHTKHFSRFCASMKLLGLREDFSAARGLIDQETAHALEAIQQHSKNEDRRNETLAEGEYCLRLARKKYLFGPEAVTITEESDEDSIMFSEIQGAWKANNLGNLLRNSRLYRYITGREAELAHQTKQRFWEHLASLREELVEGVKGSTAKFLSFAGGLRSYLKSEQKGYLQDKDVEPAVVEDNQELEGNANIHTEDKEQEEERDSSITALGKADDTKVIGGEMESVADEEGEPGNSFKGVHTLATKHPDLLQRYMQAQEEIRKSASDRKKFEDAVRAKHAVMEEITKLGLTVNEAQIKLYVEAAGKDGSSAPLEETVTADEPKASVVSPSLDKEGGPDDGEKIEKNDKLRLVDREIVRLHKERPELICDYIKAKMRLEHLLPSSGTKDMTDEEALQNVLNEIGEQQFVVTQSRLDMLYDSVVQKIDQEIQSGSKKILVATVRQQREQWTGEQIFLHEMNKTLKHEIKAGRMKPTEEEVRRWVKTHEEYKKRRRGTAEELLEQGYKPDSESVKKARKRDIRRKNKISK